MTAAGCARAERHACPHRDRRLDGRRQAHAQLGVDVNDPGAERVAHGRLDRPVGGLELRRLDETLAPPVELDEHRVAAHLDDEDLERLADARVALARRCLAGLLEKGRKGLVGAVSHGYAGVVPPLPP